MAKSVIENESIIAEQPLHVQYDSLVSMSRTHTYLLYELVVRTRVFRV